MVEKGIEVPCEEPKRQEDRKCYATVKWEMKWVGLFPRVVSEAFCIDLPWTWVKKFYWRMNLSSKRYLLLTLQEITRY